MKTALIMVLLLGVVKVCVAEIYELAQSSKEFDEYKKNHTKTYPSKAEEAYRLSVYFQNKDKIDKHNKNKSNTYTLANNHFSDLTDAEFKDKMLTLKVPGDKLNLLQAPTVSFTMPVIDWVSKGKVTKIKNQGYCGSCWAFSSAAAIESAHWIKGSLNNSDISQQQMVDCTLASPYYNTGCSGGWMSAAFQYIKAVGINTEAKYPYYGANMACRATSGPIKISGYTEKYDCAGLAASIILRPVSVAIDASNWRFYYSGIFNNCGATTLNHAVLLVGSSASYWRIKNSWGTGWGENGYIRLAAPFNTCGICRTPSYPSV